VLAKVRFVTRFYVLVFSTSPTVAIHSARLAPSNISVAKSPYRSLSHCEIVRYLACFVQQTWNSAEIRRKVLEMKRLAVVIALSLVAAACQTKAPIPANRATQDAAEAEVRSVDFLNFTYKPSCASGTVTTKNGAYDNPHDPQEDVPVHFVVNDVIYGDLRGDGSEQAVVLTGCNLGGTGYWTEAFIFELRAGKPVEVESIGGGDRAMGGIKSVRVDGHLLKVAQQYGVALCCADYIETTTYELRGNRLVPVGSPKRVAAASGTPIKSLRFEKGSSSGTINGESEDDAIYELRARAGQVLVIERLREKEPTADLGIEVMDPDGMTLKHDWDAKVGRTKLPSDGLYTLVVFSNQPNVPYAFKVTIH
jgi:hypothetical protein